MHKSKKKLLIIVVLFIVLLLPAVSLSQQTGKVLEIQYPTINNYRPITVKAFLPKYVRYVFQLAIILSGIVIFASLVWGGFLYVTASANPSNINRARDQIIASVIGAIVLLSSYLILNTINPQLIGFFITKKPVEKGIILFKTGICDINGPDEEITACNNDTDCPPGRGCLACGSWETIKYEGRGPGGENLTFPEWLYDALSEQNLAYRIKTSVPTLKGFLSGAEHITSAWFYETSSDLRAIFYNRENWQTEQGSLMAEYQADRANICGVNDSLANFEQTSSILLTPRLYGPHLCKKTYTGDAVFGVICGAIDSPGEELFLENSNSLLPENFQDQIQGLYIRNRPATADKPAINMGMVLHDDSNMQGPGELFLEDITDLSTRRPNMPNDDGPNYGSGDMTGDRVSSATVFALAEQGNGTVIFYEGVNYGGQSYECRPKEGVCCVSGDSNRCRPQDADKIPRCKKADGTVIADSMCVRSLDPGDGPELNLGIANDKIMSIKIQGNFLVILFSNKDYEAERNTILVNPKEPYLAEVFRIDDNNFFSNNIGRCNCAWGVFGGDQGCRSCVSSFIILPIETGR